MANAVFRRLPPGVVVAVSRISGKNPGRTLALPLIVLAHALVLLWIARLPPRPVPTFPVIMDIMLFPGEGSGLAGVAIPEAGEEPDPAEPSSPAEPISPEAPAPADDASETVSTISPEPSVEAEIEGNSPPELPADVLAMAEAITGASSADLARPETAVEVVAQNPSWTPSRAGAAAGGCSIDGALQALFAAEPTVRAALVAIPRDARSVANAIQLWDGAWTPPPTPEGEPALAVIRAAIVETVSQAPARCRDEHLQGPRFLIVSQADNMTTVLVLGSGDWRWTDLSPRPQPALLRWLGFRER